MGLKVRILASLSLLACFAAASNKAKADTLVIDVPVTGTTYVYDPYVPGPYSFSGFAEDALSVALPTLTNLTLANYTAVDFRISAPAGQLMTLTQNASFNFNFNYRDGYGVAQSTPCSFVYTGTGPAPAHSGTCSVGTSGQSIGFGLYSQFFAGDSFSSLDFNLLLPNNLPSAARATFTYSPNQSNEFTFSDATDTNPGAFVSFNAAPVAATPEPSSLLLLGTGIVGVAGAARRRFKK